MIYLCCDERRRTIVEQQAVFNGIEFLEVVDNPADPFEVRQRILHVHFIHPLAPGALTLQNLRIEGGERIRNIRITGVEVNGLASPHSSPPKVLPANVLVVRVAEPGDFSTYTLRLVQDAKHDDPPANFDPALSAIDFSFKVACASDFDCRPSLACPTDPKPQPEINYLAKDYASFRQLMFDRMAALIPTWKERNPADLGVALVELLAYVGDYLSYQQDAVATESYIGTARRRSSVRRHARLVDYPMHDGANARAWVRMLAAEGVDGVLLKQSHAGRPTQVLTRVADNLPFITRSSPNYEKALTARPEVFELMDDITLYAAHNVMQFYTWDAYECCLPKGAVCATLNGHYPNLNPGDVLILAEVCGPDTGQPEDADPQHRHAVRLTDRQLSFDPLGKPRATSPVSSPPSSSGLPVTQIKWHQDDALPFPLCISSRGLDKDVSVAWGNIVLVDHGFTIDDRPEDKTHNPYTTPSSLAPDYVPRPNAALVLRGHTADDDCTAMQSGSHCIEHRKELVPARYRPRLTRAPVTQAAPYGRYNELARGPSATAAMRWTMREVRPVITLTSFASSPARTFIDLTVFKTWTPVCDLLNSHANDEHVVVEVETDGATYLRFGDGQFGSRPDPEERFLGRYRIGNGLRGNVGADTLAHLVSNDSMINDQVIAGVRNPMPARGGVEAETMEQARAAAPSAFRTQERAVTAEDYAASALRCGMGVQRAAATFRWTGSWHTVFVTVDRLGGREVDGGFESDLRHCLERFRMAGHDLEVDDARFASLEIGMTVCVKPNYFGSDVKAELLEVFSNRQRPDGRRGFFHPDNFTFGQPVFKSRLYAAAQTVAGVDSVEITKLQRQGIESDVALESGQLEMARLEIARLDNDPNFPEHGVITFAMRGGR